MSIDFADHGFESHPGRKAWGPITDGMTTADVEGGVVRLTYRERWDSNSNRLEGFPVDLIWPVLYDCPTILCFCYTEYSKGGL